MPNVEDEKDYGPYMDKYISKIVNNYGPRAPGSNEESEAGKDILNELEGVADETDREKFSCHPKAFLGWMKITVPIYILSVLVYFFLPGYVWISIILSSLGLLLFFKQFLQYAEFLDPLYPEEDSYNIIGKFEPEGNIDKTLIFSGHHDSAFQFNLIAWFPKAYPILMGIAFFGVLSLPFITTLDFVLNSIWPNLPLVTLIFSKIPWIYISTLPFAFLFIFFETGKPVPGASDNLSGVAVVLGLARYLNDIRESQTYPENTEVFCVSFGCEEAGLRGSRRYVEEHLDELKGKDVEVINLETITSPENLSIVERENTTRTDHSKELVKKIKRISSDEMNYNLPTKEMSIGAGGTDATPFSRENIKAISIFGTSMEDVPEFYHTMDDTPDKIDPQALTKTLELCKEIIKFSENTTEQN